MSEQLSENIKPGPKPGLKLTRTTQGYLGFIRFLDDQR